MCLSYRHGVPAQASAPALHQYTKLALRYILHHVSEEGQHKQNKVKILSSLAEAFQECQQVQARTIDKLFGTMTGRDLGLRGQLFELVDFVKQQTLDEVTLKLNPYCLSPSADMHQQMPHIQSAYVAAVGEQLGLRGVETSRVDRLKPRLGQRQLVAFMEAYVQTFPVEDVVQAFVRDVNQTDASADRVVDHDALFAWAVRHLHDGLMLNVFSSKTTNLNSTRIVADAQNLEAQQRACVHHGYTRRLRRTSCYSVLAMRIRALAAHRQQTTNQPLKTVSESSVIQNSGMGV